MTSTDPAAVDPVSELAAQVSRLADLGEQQLERLDQAQVLMRQSVEAVRAEVKAHKKEVDEHRGLIAKVLWGLAAASALALIAVAVVAWHEWDERQDAKRESCEQTNATNAGVVDAVDIAVHEVAAELAADDGPEGLASARATADRIAGRVAEHDGLRLRDC